jgi:hypothetical protein
MGPQHVFIGKTECIGVVITVLVVAQFEFACLLSSLIDIFHCFQFL